MVSNDFMEVKKKSAGTNILGKYMPFRGELYKSIVMHITTKNKLGEIYHQIIEITTENGTGYPTASLK